MPQKFRTDTTSSKRQAKYQYSPYEPSASSSSASVKSHASGPSGPASAASNGGRAAPQDQATLRKGPAAGSGAGNRALTLLVVLGGTLYLLLQLIALRQTEFRYSVAESRFIASHRHGHGAGGGGGGGGGGGSAHSSKKIPSHNLHVEDGTGNVEVIVDGGVSNIDLGGTYGNADGGHEGRGELRVRLPNGRGEMLRPAPKLALKVNGGEAWDEDRRRDAQDNNGEGGGLRGGGAGGEEDGATGWEPKPQYDEVIAPLDAAAAIERAKQSQRDADRQKAADADRRRKAGGGGAGAGAGAGVGALNKARTEAMSHFKAHEVDADVVRPGTLDGLVHKMMPDNLKYAADVSTKPDPDHPDVPIYWDIPASGSDLMSAIVEECLHMGSVTDLQRAKGGWGLKAEDGVVLTPDIWDAINYLDGIHHGRLFAMFLHPVHRAVQMLDQQKEKDPAGIGRLGTLEEYAYSKYHEANWMVRHLAGVPKSDQPTANDLAVAKEVMRTKFIVGMVPYKDSSLKRVEEYFGFVYPKGGVDCRQRAIADATAAEKRNVKEGSKGWVVLAKANDLDIKLYEYANHLFFAQKDMFI